MEQNNLKNVTKKNISKSFYSAVRVSSVTQKKLTTLLNKINKKDFGKRVKGNELLEVALGLIGDHHIKKLQDNSLSSSDIFEMRLRDYIKQNGKISKDDYLGILLKDSETKAS